MNDKSIYGSLIQKILGRFSKKQGRQIEVEDALTYSEEVLKDWTLYRSQPKELISVFSSLGETYPNSFWSNASDVDSIVPRTVGMPKRMIDRMVAICSNSLHNIIINNKEYQKIWDDMLEDYDLKENVIIPAMTASEVVGDCVVVTFADGKTPYPYFKLYNGDQFQPIFVNNRYKGAKVYDLYFKEEGKDVKPYLLETTIKFGFVSYQLIDENGDIVPLTELEETSELQDFSYNKKICYATLLRFKKSNIYKDRGESSLYGREGAFGALDEVYSIWMSTPAINRASVFEDVSMAERNRFGKIIKRKRLLNFFRKSSDLNTQYSSGDNRKLLEVYNPTWSVDNFIQTHNTNVQECLKDYISPSTISYNSQNLSVQANASYNAQIEKATIETRRDRLEKLGPFIKKLIKSAIACYLQQCGKEMEDFEISIDFCEFESPSIEEKTEVFSKQVAAGLCSRKYAMGCLNPDLGEDDINDMYLEYLKEQKDLANLIEYDNEQYVEEPMVENIEGEPMIDNEEVE